MLGMGHPEEKIRVVHNGVATSPIEIELGNKSVFWTLGMVALFRPRKGVEVLLEAMRLLCEQNLPVRLRCVGTFETAEYELEVLELAQKLNVGHLIEWTGFERDVKSRLKEMQIMVLPSQFGEGLPMVVLEAMAVGLPVIASKVEGIPEAIRDGQDGLLFTPNNPEELAGQIRQLVKNRSLWHEISHSAWQRQRSEFSDRSMAARIASVYDELR
jgi:glycosyltransferase involved in cell wall biosynthesis